MATIDPASSFAPSSATASPIGSNSLVVRRSFKRARTEGPSTLPEPLPPGLIAKIVILGNFSDAMHNELWISPRDVHQLFMYSTVLASGPRYIQVANQIYNLKISPWIPPGVIALNKYQYRDCEDATFPQLKNNNIMLSPLDVRDHSHQQLYHALFEIEVHPSDFSKQTSEPITLSLQKLRGYMQRKYEQHFFRKGQSLLIHLPEGTFVLKMISPIFNPLLNSGAQPRHGWISASTLLDFKIKEASEIILFDQVISDGIKRLDFTLSIKNKTGFSRIRRRYTQDDFEQGKTPLPISCTCDHMQTFIKEQLKGKTLKVGDRNPLGSVGGHEVIAELKKAKINPEQFPLLPSRSIVDEGYTRMYQLQDTTAISIDSSRDLIISKSSVLTASELRFEILSVDPENDEEVFNPKYHWVNVKELTATIREMGIQLACNEKLVLHHNTERYLIQLSKAKADGVTRREEKYSTLWGVGEESKLKFQVASENEIKLVADSNPHQLREVTIEVTPSSRKSTRSFFDEDEEDSETQSVDIRELRKLAEERLPVLLIKGQNFSVSTEDDQNLKFRIKGMQFQESDIPSSMYNTLATQTSDTKIKFVVKPESAMSIFYPQRDIRVSNIDQALQGMGLGGLGKQFKRVLRKVLLPTEFKDELTSRNLKPVRGLLLYGPPGTGKTTLARQIGTLLGCQGERLKMLAGPSIWNKWLGNSEKAIRDLFKPAREASTKYGSNSPLYVIVIDEIDAILRTRHEDNARYENSVVDQFIAEMDGLNPLNNILVVGLTNHKDLLDPAVVRKGRLGDHISIGFPDRKGREEIFQIHIKTTLENGFVSDDVDFNTLSEMTKGWTGADIEGLVNEANSLAFARKLEAYESDESEEYTESKYDYSEIGKIRMSDFTEAINLIKPKKDEAILSYYT